MQQKIEGLIVSLEGFHGSILQLEHLLDQVQEGGVNSIAVPLSLWEDNEGLLGYYDFSVIIKSENNDSESVENIKTEYGLPVMATVYGFETDAKTRADILCVKSDRGVYQADFTLVESAVPTVFEGCLSEEEVTVAIREGYDGVVVPYSVFMPKTVISNFVSKCEKAKSLRENPPKTEDRNENSLDIDRLSTYEILKKINDEDCTVASEVRRNLGAVSTVVDVVYDGFIKGGRVLYCGAGTSGRLGVVDSAECPPTYGIAHDRVVATMAGGRDAVFRASENKEDSFESGYESAKELQITENDVAIGISANGNAQFCLGFMTYAKENNAKTVAIVNNQTSKMSDLADYTIKVLTGAEVVKGSTRMKGATAQKMVINMISTSLFIKYGCVISNLMVNMNPNNIKLRARAINMLSALNGKSEDECKALLENNGWSIRKALEEK